MSEYPHEDGDVIVLGPQVYVSRDEAVLRWKGRKYVPQSRATAADIAADAAAEAVGNMAEKLSELLAERDLLRAVAFMLYRTLSDEPIESLEWLSPEHRELLAGVVSDLSPRLNPERARTAMQDVVAERDRLRAIVDAALEVVRPMADSACDADVLRIADLYRILAGPALDVSAEATDG